MKKLLPVILPALALLACSTQEICDDDSQSLMVVRLKSLVEGEAVDTVMTGLTVFGMRPGLQDSLLYDSVSASRMELPLAPGRDTSRFLLSGGDRQDILTLVHSSEAYLISFNCGFAARFLLEQTGGSSGWIRDTEVIEPEVDAELLLDEEHLWIYF